MSEKPETPQDSNPAPIGEISQGPSGFEQFLDDNQKKLIIGGIALIILLVGWVIVDGLKTQGKKQAAAAFSAATDISEYRKVIDEHKGSNAAGSALFRIAQLQWADQRQEDAITTLKQFIEEETAHPLIHNAKAALASYQLQLGNLGEAKEFYDKVAKIGAGHELYPLALLNLGDIARREGDNEAAKEYYERIGNEFEQKPLASLKQMAADRLTLIGISPPTPKEEPKPEPPKPVTPEIPAIPANPNPPTDSPEPTQPAQNQEAVEETPETSDPDENPAETEENAAE